VAGRAGTGLRAARPGRPRAERVDGQAFVDRPVDGPGLPADPADSRFDHTTARAADGTGDGTVVVAGDGAGPQARRLAEAGGWPLLAEPSSGARSGPNAVGPYRLLLELPELGGRVRRAVVLGRPTLSRPVTRLLARAEVEVVLVTPYADWPEPGRPVRRIVGCATATGLGAVGRGANRADQHTWLGAWLAAGAAAQTALDAVLDADVDHGREAGRVAGPGGPRPTRLLTGPLVAREVAAALAPGELLVAAASNPVRDLDLAARPFDAPSDVPSDVPSAGPHDRAGTDHVRVVANRGLSGIDGTLSTAIGAALARDPDAGNLGEAAGAAASSQGGATPSGRHVRVLVGDVAFLHDANALLADPARARPDVQVVVLNDDGGGIFSLLEHGELATRGAAQADAFERVFGTPHGADLAALCRGYGVRHVRVEDLAGLRAALARPLDGTSVVEVRATRDGLRDLHARIRADVHAAARAALGPYDALGPHDERSGAPS
jgi:2-succinyl-5-enolpyruvyl-6-hydroxy-3-cyclohexene-1-carboxylate synthase